MEVDQDRTALLHDLVELVLDYNQFVALDWGDNLLLALDSDYTHQVELDFHILEEVLDLDDIPDQPVVDGILEVVVLDWDGIHLVELDILAVAFDRDDKPVEDSLVVDGNRLDTVPNNAKIQYDRATVFKITIMCTKQ